MDGTEVLKTRIKQLEMLTWVEVKRVRHDGAKEYVTNNLKAWYEDKGITSEMTVPYKSQQNGKAKQVNHTLMERVRAAMLDSGAKEDLWAEALRHQSPGLVWNQRRHPLPSLRHHPSPGLVWTQRSTARPRL